MAARRKTWRYYTLPDGSQSVRAEMEALTQQGHARGISKLVIKADNYAAGLINPSDVDNLGGGVLELRAKLGSNCYRMLFAMYPDDEVLALLVVYKDQNRLDQRTMRRAFSRKAEWEERMT